MQKVEGNATSTPRAPPPSRSRCRELPPRLDPMKVEDAKLRSLLGVASINFKRGDQRLAIIDTPLQG